MEDAAWSTWVHWAVDRFGSSLRVACSLSVEDSLVIDAIAERVAALGLASESAPSVFVLDTGRLHEESHRLLEALRERYRLTFSVVVPDPARLGAVVVGRSGPPRVRAASQRPRHQARAMTSAAVHEGAA